MNVKRLLQLHARNTKIPYAQVLMHYAMERFLHRLSLHHRHASVFACARVGFMVQGCNLL